jgi:hypothetical protein
MEKLNINVAHVNTMIDIIAEESKQALSIFFKSPWNDIESVIDTCLTKHEELRSSEQAFKMIFKYIHNLEPLVSKKIKERALHSLQDRLHRLRIQDS